jgi:hypothetical protein
VITTLNNPTVFNIDGKVVSCEVALIDDLRSKVTFLAENQTFGYTSFGIKAGGNERQIKAVGSDPFLFENQYFQCTLLPDGTFSSLKLGPDGVELLDTSNIRGNQLAGQDSTNLGSKHDRNINIGNVGESPIIMWESPARGPEMEWETEGQPEIFESPLRTLFHANGKFNSQIKGDLQITFYNDLPRIDFEWKFEFNKASVGSFFDDESKLRVQWPLSFFGDHPT